MPFASAPRRGSPLWLPLFGLLVVLAASACRETDSAESESQAPWNVLLVTFDTTRADRIGCYGNERIETPVLDRLAADGVRFARTLSAVPITAPSHSTILTGRYPLAHGVRDNGLFSLGDEQLTLAEILSEQGYVTAAAVGAYPLISRFGLDQGFGLFDDHLTGSFEDYLGNRVVAKDRLFFDERRAAQVNDAIVPWISEHADEPFFAWVHYFDPHQPFEPAPPYDQLYADSPYDGEIAYADSRLGALLDHLERLDVLDRTLVVMTADHGEGLGDHNEITHALLAYNSTLHVPLIVRPPSGAPAGTVVEEWVGTVDIVPTILELLDIEEPPTLQGRSLVPFWERGTGSGETERDDELPLRYAENLSQSLTHGWGELRVILDGSLKYIHGPRPELFDLEADPDELTDLIDERPAEASRLRAALEDFIERNAVAGVSTPEELDEETRERLEALGYLHASGNAGEAVSEVLREGGVAPQDRVGDLNRLSSAKHLLFLGRAAEALVYTEQLVSSDPGSPLYLELHASALGEVDRLDEASQVMQRLSEVGAVPEPLVLRMATRRFERGEQRAALATLQRYVTETPSARSVWLLATLHQALGEHDQAGSALERALEIDTGFAPARIDLAVRAAREGDTAAAEAQFVQALEDAPYYAKGFYNFGTFLLQNGRFEESESHFRRAIALAPHYLKPHLALVATHIAAEDRAGAHEAYEVLRQLAPRSAEATAAAELLQDSSRE